MSQYGTLITRIGLAKIANAQVTQSTVGLEYIALGDGNGAHYVPTQDQTELVNEVWRGPIANLSIDPNNSNRIIADAVIPNTAGGFTIREIGLFDEDNYLIAVGQYPETYKPLLNEGISEELLIHFTIETANADVVKLAIDPTVIIASRTYVDEKVGEVRDDLTAHKADDAKHTSQEEKNIWNNKADGNHEHDAGEITSGIFSIARLPSSTSRTSNSDSLLATTSMVQSVVNGLTIPSVAFGTTTIGGPKEILVGFEPKIAFLSIRFRTLGKYYIGTLINGNEKSMYIGVDDGLVERIGEMSTRISGSKILYESPFLGSQGIIEWVAIG